MLGLLISVSACAPISSQNVGIAINHARLREGLLPLKINADLEAAASWYARDLAARPFSPAHIDSQGRDPFDRMRAFGVPAYDFAAENSFPGARNDRHAVDGWLRSEGHRANLLSEEAREMGVGAAASNQTAYVALLAGLRNRFPIVINADEPSTSDPSLRLSIHGKEHFSEIRLSTDGGATWTAWRQFASNLRLDVDRRPGVKTVTVEMRGRRTCRATDEIVLNRP